MNISFRKKFFNRYKIWYGFNKMYRMCVKREEKEWIVRKERIC